MGTINKQWLERLVEHLNRVAGEGHQLDGAYGKWRVTTQGGSHSLLPFTGYVPKKELYGLLLAYIEGYYSGKGE